jgi:hypothetical protein
MGAGYVGVEVDHLGFEPQPELHAETGDLVDQGVPPARPDLRRDRPVAETRAVVPPGPEPAVVEDVAFDAELGRSLSQGHEAVKVVVEVDGFPHVDRHGAISRGMLGPRAEVPVEAACHGVEAHSVGAVDPRRGVAVPVVQDDLVGQQQLAAADHLLAGGQPLGVVGVVAAPAGVDRPDLAVGEGEPGLAQVQHGGGVGAGPALAPFAQMGADPERLALWRALPAPAPTEVEDLPCHGRDGEGDDQVVHGVGLTAVPQLDLTPHQAADQYLEAHRQLELGHRVGGVDLDQGRPVDGEQVAGRGVRAGAAADPEGRRLELRRPRPAAARPADAGPSDPPRPVLGQQGEPDRLVDGVGRHRVDTGQGQRGRVLGREGAEVRAPVDDRGQASGTEVEHDVKVGLPDAQEPVGVGGHDTPG